MKESLFKHNLPFLLLLAGLAGLGCTSCSDDNDEPTNQMSTESERNAYFKYDASDVLVEEDTTFNVFDEIEKHIKATSGGNGEEEEAMHEYYTQMYDDLKAIVEHKADSICAVNPGNSLEAVIGQISEMGRVTITYTDLSADGTYKRMSTRVVYPTRFTFDINANNIILGCHYTITSNAECPTNMGFQSLVSDACLLGAEWATSNNNLVVMPDYEGFGASVSSTHPYLIREVQARQCLKALIVAMNWFTGTHGKEFNEGNVVVEGFSQGGAVAAATYRYWLEHLNDDWAQTLKTPILGAVCSDGPYDPLATLQYYCKNNILTMPVAPVLMLKGLCETDRECIKAGLEATDFFSKDFCNTDIFRRVNAKTYTTTQCEYALRDNPGSMTIIGETSVSASDAFNKETYEYFRNDKEPTDNPQLLKKLKVLKHCLEKNALTYGFDPSAGFDLEFPIMQFDAKLHVTPNFTFFHGKHDTVVPIDNLNGIKQKWSSSVYKLVTCPNIYDHGKLAVVFFLQLHDKYVQEMFKREWKPGTFSFVTADPVK